ncbi:Hydroxymethylpyrimidine/phosphomethylpyrimidine kinase [Methylobrevis pamukkalensis]|uniref:hydroxymethylpyrimidine kinase n=1 Tax=Methylobrevis pamukkalensis TaxID=1439726 RepID=A0A1E3H522_9HYPH|nr:Hydroxymethylpyrimidine/phosphomethylpyrimidine kinase [Methylobrevis pamukkalensis]
MLDPVMIAASGDPLLRDDAVATLRELLLPRAMLLTPNLPEAARLLDEPQAVTRADMERQAHALRALGAGAVLVKGGHGTEADSADVLVTAAGTEWFTAPRHATQNTHGTGCTLSSAIAAGLAKGLALPQAVAEAKVWLTAAIVAADGLAIGGGHGPVHHFHALWPAADD